MVPGSIERGIRQFIERAGTSLKPEPKSVGIHVPTDAMGRTIVVDVTNQPVLNEYDDRLMKTWVTAAGETTDRDVLIKRDGKASNLEFQWSEAGVTLYVEGEIVDSVQQKGNFFYRGLPALLITFSDVNVRLLCFRTTGSSWSNDIAPYVNSNSLVSGNGVLGGIFRDAITAGADNIWSRIQRNGKS